MSILKKTVLLALMLFVVSNLSAGNPIEKLGRGVAGIIASPMEIMMKPVDVSREQGNIAGVTHGLFLGVAYAIGRIGVGVADICTFLIPLPGCTDTPYETGWGYGPMAFRDSPWVVDIEHNWGGFFYESGSLIQSEF